MDFRHRDHTLRLSDNGKLVEVDFDVLGANRKWKQHVLRLELAEGQLVLDPGRRPKAD